MGRVWEGVSPSHLGILGYTKTSFLWVIKFKLTSILAPNVYDCSIRGGGDRFCC